MLLRMLRGIPGLLPLSMASPIVWADDFTVSATWLIVDLASNDGSGETPRGSSFMKKPG